MKGRYSWKKNRIPRPRDIRDLPVRLSDMGALRKQRVKKVNSSYQDKFDGQRGAVQTTWINLNSEDGNAWLSPTKERVRSGPERIPHFLLVSSFSARQGQTASVYMVGVS